MTDRDKMIVIYYQSGMSYRQIATYAGLSHQRVHQILKAANVIQQSCSSCGSLIKSRRSGNGLCYRCHPRDPKRRPCTVLGCLNRTNRVDGRCYRCYVKVRYREDPEFRKRNATSTQKYKDKMKSDPAWRKRQLEYQKRSNARRRARKEPDGS